MKKSQNSQVATKSDIKLLKVDIQFLDKKIDGVEKRLDNKIDGVEERLDKKIDGVEDRLTQKLDNIANTLDGFVGVVDDLRIENEVGANQIRDLDKRVTKLESSQAA